MNEKVSEVVIENVNLNNATPQVLIWREYADRRYRPSAASYKRICKLIRKHALVVNDIYIGVGGISVRFDVNV